MPRDQWTNETTKQAAHFLWQLCQPTGKPSDALEPIDWGQLLRWLEAQRDAAIRKQGAKRKPKKRPH